MKAILVLSLVLVACKYPELPPLMGDAQGVDTRTTDGQPVDAAAIDAPPDAPRFCYVPMDLNSLTLGSSSSPVTGNWFKVQSGGPNAGKDIFTMSANFQTSRLTFEVAKPTTGFATNTPYAFATAPNTAWVAQSFIYGGYNSTDNTHQQMVYSATGSITFTSIGFGTGTVIAGSVSTTMYREVDEATNTIIPGGCTTTIQVLQFNLRQN